MQVAILFLAACGWSLGAWPNYEPNKADIGRRAWNQHRPLYSQVLKRPGTRLSSRLAAEKATTQAELDAQKEFDDYWLEDDLKEANQQPINNEIATERNPPSACVWAIVTCCSPKAATPEIRYHCFERVGCHGAFWDVNPCEKQMMQAALRATGKFYKINQ